jgi:DNA-binding transcriptional ArsR family regulator
VIRVRLGDEDHVAVRVVVSPFLNVVVCLLEFFLDARTVWNRRWQEIVRERVAGLDLTPFAVLRSGRELPDFMAPIPRPPGLTFEAELERVRSASPELVRADVEAVAGDRDDPAVAAFRGDPERALAAYCDALEAFWARVFAPSWTRMLSLLEREVIVLGAALATRGIAAIRTRLHPLVAYEPGLLALDVTDDRELELGDRVIVLSPLVVGDRRILWNVDQPDTVTLAYQAPGVMLLWEGGELPVDRRLAAVVGGARARVLGVLGTPMTLTDLTDTLSLARGSVAPQLSTLTDAGLLTRSRVGRRVYYRLSSAGRELVALLASDEVSDFSDSVAGPARPS